MLNISPDSNIVILTGAGISAESNLATFRANDGLWANYKIEDVCTPQALARNPALVHEFYNFRRRELLKPDVSPNPAHYALTKLQQEWKGQVTLVTQNVDDLHERSGSPNVIHMHGELKKLRCTDDDNYHIFETDQDSSPEQQCETCGKNLRPDIVFFQEIPYYLDRIHEALQNAQMFVSIGTSGNVYPAAGYVDQARRNRAETVEINLEPSKNAYLFSTAFYGKASIEVPKFVDSLLQLKP